MFNGKLVIADASLCQSPPDACLSLEELCARTPGEKRLLLDNRAGKQEGFCNNHKLEGKASIGGATGIFRAGKREGLWKVYLPSGKLTENRNYLTGKLDGINESFDEKGNLSQKHYYNKDVLVKVQSLKSGRVDTETVFSYREDGVTAKSAEIFKKGKRIRKIDYGKSVK